MHSGKGKIIGIEIVSSFPGVGVLTTKGQGLLCGGDRSVLCLSHGLVSTTICHGLPGSSDGKASQDGSSYTSIARNAGDPGSIPRLGRSPGEGNGNPLQYSCLENSMDGGPWWATVRGVTKSRTQLSDFTHCMSWSGCGLEKNFQT